jgi:hypothetical protein
MRLGFRVGCRGQELDQPLAPSHLRPHVAKVPQQRKIRQTTLLPVANYLKQAFEFRSTV